LREKERRLTELSITDELTGLYNRRWFSSKINSEMDHARRLGRPLSLVVVDVDHFKKFNDTYGHAQGDNVLAELGKTIFDTVRLYDIPCRYGGEEFVIILPGASENDAFSVAERLRKSFARKKIAVPGRSPIGATISIGVAQMGNEESADSFFQRADDALYRAKHGGRNQVVMAG
jgi:diguanylate cyclase (GGDEF)-like protein